MDDKNTLSSITDWLNSKAKTDDDMYYVGLIAGTFLAVERHKAEIEQFTEERNKYKDLYETMYRKYSDLQDKEFNCEALRKEKNEYLDKAAELQKQVDELKEQRDVFKRLFESVNISNFSTDSIIEIMNSFYREQAEHLAGLKIEQATKDAVKKFADLVEFHSIARMNDGVEYFTISALGLKEILTEEFGFKYYELDCVEVE